LSTFRFGQSILLANDTTMRTSASKSIASKADAADLTVSSRGAMAAMLELTKPRLSMMAIFSTMLGYLAATSSTQDHLNFVFLLLGTALAAGGAAALNQWMERHEDARMERTADRPLPTGAIEPGVALVFGMILSTGGLACLWFGVNGWATALTAATLVSYLVFYTPLKKRTPIATEVGAVSGALPPLMGWAAATNEPSAFGWLLFAILFAWQMPHFMAISWTYREEYRKAGFKMLSHAADGAVKVARKSMFYSLLLAALAISPVYYDYGVGLSGIPYLCVASILSLGLFFSALRFMQAEDKTSSARSLFFVTIIHLPLLLAALVTDRYL
jgi:protoheme IX farnesyltransferase